MKHRHRSPKRFSPPKTWRGRNSGDMHAYEILKDIWTNGYRRPWWARLAYARHWMTADEYYALEQTERDPRGSIADRIYSAVYANNPLYALLPK